VVINNADGQPEFIATTVAAARIAAGCMRAPEYFSVVRSEADSQETQEQEVIAVVAYASGCGLHAHICGASRLGRLTNCT